MTPARMVELLDSQAAAIERLTAELAEAEARAERWEWIAGDQAALVDKWAWVARFCADEPGAEPGAIDLALEAWADEQESKGKQQ